MIWSWAMVTVTVVAVVITISLVLGGMVSINHVSAVRNSETSCVQSSCGGAIARAVVDVETTFL